VVGRRAAEQATMLLDLLAGPPGGHERLVLAAAATGALRRPLRMPGIDPVRDRELIISAALGALGSEIVGGITQGAVPTPSIGPARATGSTATNGATTIGAARAPVATAEGGRTR